MTKKLSTIILIGLLLVGGIFYPEIFGEGGSEDLEVHYIDVGQGDSILIKGKDKNMLIDAGSNSYRDFLIDYIEAQNIDRLDYVVATHPHEDHIGSMDEVIDYFNVENIIMPDVVHTSRAFENLIDSIDRNNLSITLAKPGDRYDLNGAQAIILAPIGENYSGLNNYSVVIKLVNGENSFLFTGDAESISENEMLNRNTNILDSHALKLGHHGSSSSTTEDFFKAVSPDYAIISAGYENSYGHPHWEIIERLESNNIEYYRTDLDGTIVIRSDGQKISIVK